jgi:hypothetical protein
MMVENQVRSRDVRQVGRDVVRTDVDLPVLHVLGVNELDLLDHVEVLQQHRTHQTVEIAACDKAEFSHESPCGWLKGFGPDLHGILALSALLGTQAGVPHDLDDVS